MTCCALAGASGPGDQPMLTMASCASTCRMQVVRGVAALVEHLQGDAAARRDRPGGDALLDQAGDAGVPQGVSREIDDAEPLLGCAEDLTLPVSALAACRPGCGTSRGCPHPASATGRAPRPPPASPPAAPFVARRLGVGRHAVTALSIARRGCCLPEVCCPES